MKKTLFLLCLALCFVCKGGTLQTFNGESYQGKLALEGPTSVSVAPDSGSVVKVDFNNVLDADFRDKPEVLSFGSGVMLKNGLFFPDVIESFDVSGVKLRDSATVVPTSEIAMVVFRTMPVSYAAKLAAGTTGAVLPNGDFFQGQVKGFESGHAKIDSVIFGLKNFDVTKDILAVVLGSFQQFQSHCLVQSIKGGVFPLNSVQIEGDAILVRDPIFKEFRIRSEDIAIIRAGGARCRWLTDIQGIKVNPQPGADAAKAVSFNKTLNGRSLLIDAHLYDHGIEMACGASIFVPVPPGMGIFTAQVSISDNSPAKERYVVTVAADGRLIYRSPERGAADKPFIARAIFGNAQILTLRVESATPQPAGSLYLLNPLLLKR